MSEQIKDGGPVDVVDVMRLCCGGFVGGSHASDDLRSAANVVANLVGAYRRHGEVLRQYLRHLKSTRPTQSSRPRMCDVNAALEGVLAALDSLEAKS